MINLQINIDGIKVNTEEYIVRALSSMFFKVLEGQADYIIQKVDINIFTQYSKRYILITIPIKHTKDDELIKLGFSGHKKGDEHTLYYKIAFNEDPFLENKMFWLFITNFKKDYPNEFDLEVKLFDNKGIYDIDLKTINFNKTKNIFQRIVEKIKRIKNHYSLRTYEKY